MKWRPQFSLASLVLLVLSIASVGALFLHWDPWASDRTVTPQEACAIVYTPPSIGQLDGLVGCGHLSRTFVAVGRADMTLQFLGDDAATTDLAKGIEFINYAFDGRRLAERREGTIWIWDTVHGVVIASFEFLSPQIRHGTFSRDNSRFAVMDGDERVHIWDASRGHTLCTFTAQGTAVAFSEDGRHLYTGWPGVGRARKFSLRRPERWWGIAWLPEAWFAFALSLTLAWSIVRDRCSMGAVS